MGVSSELEGLLSALRAAARGQVGVRLDVGGRGPMGEIALEFNTLMEELARRTPDRTLELLGGISHELRNPLNSLLILARVLAEGTDPTLSGRQLEYVRAIRASGGDLLALLDQVLELAKLDANSAPPADVALADLVAELRGEFEPRAREARLAFRVEAAPGLPSAVCTDPAGLRQLLKNLLGSAFRGAAPGGVEVRIRGARDDERLSWAPRVIAFEVRGAAGGAGFGLAISQELARMLGGELEVRRRAEGSTFTLYLPLDRRGAASAPGRTARLEGAERPRLLVIEDHPAFGASTAELAEKLGYRVELARSAEAGLAAAFLRLPDAVLLEARLGGPNAAAGGWSLLEHLWRSPRARRVPLQVVLADAERSLAPLVWLDGALERPALEAALDHLGSTVRPIRRVLIVEPEDPGRRSVATLVPEGVDLLVLGSVRAAAAALEMGGVDAAIVDLALPTEAGVDLTEAVLELRPPADAEALPMIVFAGSTLPPDEARLQRAALESRLASIPPARFLERVLGDPRFLPSPIAPLDDPASTDTLDPARASALFAAWPRV
jgi:CheY-like chemotaxis protein